MEMEAAPERQSLLRRFYHRVMALSRTPAAAKWLGVIAFTESSVFPLPADLLFLPMALSNPQKAYRYAWIATIASCLGSVLGYFIGMYGYELIALPMLEAMGKADSLDHYRELIQSDIVILWGLLLSSGLTHVPPIKVVTIVSGFSGVHFGIFMASAFISRGARFFLFAWLLKKYGVSIRHFIEKRFALVSGLSLAALVGIYMLIKYISH
jgi:membrane protein YqaA with SNARE-associated domain